MEFSSAGQRVRHMTNLTEAGKLTRALSRHCCSSALDASRGTGTENIALQHLACTINGRSQRAHLARSYIGGPNLVGGTLTEGVILWNLIQWLTASDVINGAREQTQIFNRAHLEH